MKRARVNAQSRKRRQLAPKRADFVRDFLGKNPRCQVRWDHRCTGVADHVHEALTRARGGVIVPTPGKPQKFVAVCWSCHRMIHAYPAIATQQGWLIDGHGRGAQVDQVIVDDPPQYRPRGHPVAATEAFLARVAKRHGLGG